MYMAQILTEFCQKAVKKMSKTSALYTSFESDTDLRPETVDKEVSPYNLSNYQDFFLFEPVRIYI